MRIEDISPALTASFFQIFPIAAKIIVVLALFLLGYLVAKALGWLVAVFARLIQVDLLSQKSGLDALLEKADIKKTTSELIGNLIYWIVVFVFFIAVLGYFHLPVQAILVKVFSYMGIVFLAAFILALGVFLAGLIAGLVKVVMATLGMDGAKSVSRIVYYIVIIFSFLLALAELGIPTAVFVPQIGVIIGAIGLAAAIAFGLGCKDMAADFLYNLFRGK